MVGELGQHGLARHLPVQAQQLASPQEVQRIKVDTQPLAQHLRDQGPPGRGQRHVDVTVLHGVVVGQIRHERIHAQRIPFGPDLTLSRDIHLAALARDQIRPRVGARHTGQQRWCRQPDPVVAITCGMRYRTRGHDLVRQRHARPVARQNIVLFPLLSCRGGGRFPHMYRIRGRFRRILSTEAGAIGIRCVGVALWLRL